MPSRSAQQHRLMAMASSPEGRAKLKSEGVDVPPLSVAHEFLKADKRKRLRKAIMAKASK